MKNNSNARAAQNIKLACCDVKAQAEPQVYEQVDRLMKAGDLTKSEALFQAEFYHQARKIGLPVFLELTTPVGRLDIAVFNRPMDAVVAIVECKRDPRSQDRLQADRYLKIGAPLYWCCSMEDAARLPPLLMEEYYEFSGVKLDTIMSMPRVSPESRYLAKAKRMAFKRAPIVDRWMEHLSQELMSRAKPRPECTTGRDIPLQNKASYEGAV